MGWNLNNEWVRPLVEALNLNHHENLDSQFLPFIFGAIEFKINLGLEVEELEM